MCVGADLSCVRPSARKQRACNLRRGESCAPRWATNDARAICVGADLASVRLSALAAGGRSPRRKPPKDRHYAHSFDSIKAATRIIAPDPATFIAPYPATGACQYSQVRDPAMMRQVLCDRVGERHMRLGYF